VEKRGGKGGDGRGGEKGKERGVLCFIKRYLNENHYRKLDVRVTLNQRSVNVYLLTLNQH